MTVKVVDFSVYQDEIVAMMLQMLHLEPVPVDIDVSRYVELQKLGFLLPVLWFGDDDFVKGVALLFVSQSLRNSAVLHASTDVLFVKPCCRGGSSVFLDGIKSVLKDIGVDYFMVSSRDVVPIDRFLLGCGFSPLERVFFCEV